ncbi:MAG: hypothetical protein CBB71_11175 [Rhodopirellula sp. TMED11]|nr:MAG: hypothetical protein CBB71_11175 [Rhodopirellula sp. TMED11]
MHVKAVSVGVDVQGASRKKPLQGVVAMADRNGWRCMSMRCLQPVARSASSLTGCHLGWNWLPDFVGGMARSGWGSVMLGNAAPHASQRRFLV